MTAPRRPGIGWRLLALAGLPACTAVLAGTADRPAPAPHREDVPTVEAQAQGGSYALRRHVIAGGGGSSSGGAFAVSGTIGQPDADPLQPSTGGVVAITGGFWPGIAPAAPQGEAVFANGFEALPP